MKTPFLTALIILGINGFAPAQTYRTFEDLKNLDGFVQKLPKGSIAPINQPKYVSAAQSGISDNTWIIGVVANGEARAYSINLLNSHTVVNDTIGGRSMAVVWGPFSNIATVYDREVDGETLDFAVSGAIYHNAIVLFDSQTDSYWPIATGEAIGGPKQGTRLNKTHSAQKTLFGFWKKQHPNTQVLSLEGVSHIDQNPYLQILSSPKPFIPVKKLNKSFPPKTSVYAFDMDGKAYAISHDRTAGGWQGKAGGKQIFFFRPLKSSPFMSTLAYNLGSEKLKKKDTGWVSKTKGAFNPWTGAFEKGGGKAQLLTGIDTFWCVWSSFHKKVKILNPPRRGHSKFEKEEAARINASDKPLIFGKN